MPKRRISTARSRAASAKNLIKARSARHWPAPQPGSFGTVRRHKLGGKGYQHKGGSNFKVASEATAILAGKAGFRDPELADLGHPQGQKPPDPTKWLPKAKRKKPNVNQLASHMHGSGTGLSSHYRYLPVNVAKRKKGRH